MVKFPALAEMQKRFQNLFERFFRPEKWVSGRISGDVSHVAEIIQTKRGLVTYSKDIQ